MTERITFTGKVEAEGRRIRGEVILAGARTFRNGEWLEIDPAAIVKADASEVFASWEHDDAKLLAAVANDTLRVERTEHGFTYETDELPNTTYADDALELIRGGYVTGTSFEIEGPVSKFETDPDGTRVRRYTSIKRLRQVGPVRAPAFTTSSAAAFSEKGSNMTAPVIDPAEEPKVDPPKVEFAADDKSETYRTAEAFARKQDLPELAQAMENLLTGDLTPAKGEAYDAFAAVYDERKKIDTEAKDRFERLQLAQAMRLGKMPKAPETGLFESDDYSEAFSRYIRGNVSAMDQFAQSISGSGAEGGYTVPEDFRTEITRTMAAYGGIQQRARVLETSDGRVLPWPTVNDTANSAVVASEGAAPASAGADVVFGEVSLGAFSIAASGTGNAPIKVSWELLQDSAFDFAGLLSSLLGERLGRKAASYYAVGVGTTEPFGLLAKTPDTMTATTMYAALVEHSFQVNEAYRTGGACAWVMSDATLAKVYNSVDLNGRPLFIPSADSSGAGRPAGILLGYPVQLDQASGNLVAFGDIGRGFVIRRVRNIEVVVDPYNNTATRQTAYHAWLRTDSNVQDSAAYSVSDYASVTADATA